MSLNAGKRNGRALHHLRFYLEDSCDNCKYQRFMFNRRIRHFSRKGIAILQRILQYKIIKTKRTIQKIARRHGKEQMRVTQLSRSQLLRNHFDLVIAKLPQLAGML